MAHIYNAKTTANELTNDLAHEISGKVVMITGPSPGSIGATFVKSIAKAQPGLLVLAGRNLTSIQRTADGLAANHPAIQVRLLELDVGSLAAVRTSAATFNAWDDVPKLDVLINNAGIWAVEFALSKDGYESTFATNHLGPFLFTNLIMKKILASSSPRVVNVSSNGHRLSPIRWGDYNFRDGETYNKWSAYGQSKTANMLFALSLAKTLGPKLLAFSLHPGTILTNMTSPIGEAGMAAIRDSDKAMGNAEAWKEYIFKSEQEGAATHIYAAFEPSLSANNGAYLEDSHVADPWVQTVKPWGTSTVEAERLWKLSENLVGETFNY
ncbi:hypothetical protein BKA67DRAFT_40559 [Truncatella angustata]|uniref:Uncharacterized protein n=1 Tax=Truncatella angustata TaxID=152316 RepID=A0A9P8UXM7_9PEZI|nr:uncharacterized protein BKA67DRAFT_40559 [Truncatella angustata]KAH6660112.1 hypothetical protein BKA67DRAFT_40559 [Truncatella angustata]KAH8202622.1 hypothetical protein TruAng_003223 [Truncatella angustata]